MNSPDAGPHAFVPRVLAVVGIVVVATFALLLAWQAAALLLVAVVTGVYVEGVLGGDADQAVSTTSPRG